jgi:hypothetical protein
MDMADLVIEGAGVVLLAVIVGGAFAIAAQRQRIVLGMCIGLALGLLALPFIAYLAARLTNHLATNADMTPPMYIIVTALACGGLALIGTVGGLIADARRRSLPAPSPRPTLSPDDAYIDDPSQWIPWMRRDEPPTS